MNSLPLPAASATNAAAMGWSRRLRVGVFGAALSALALAAPALLANTFTVKTTADAALPPPDSLRWAILQVNGTPGAHTIEFHIPGAGPYVITLAVPLPNVMHPVTIDGTTQDPLNPNPVIALNGGWPNGLVLDAGNSIVRDLCIQSFNYGIVLEISGNNTISSNFIGTDLTGTVAAGNGIGVYINGCNDNVIGPGNVISGNRGQGVAITSGGFNNRVIGNLIGTDLNGTGPLGNNTGVLLLSHDNFIGGLTTAERNVISGNLSQGIGLLHNPAFNNAIQGNYIGVNASGTAALANGSSGVSLFYGPFGNMIGGTVAGAGNVISGNADSGVLITGGTTFQNWVLGNFIGTSAAGDAPIPNLPDGVTISAGAYNNFVGGPGSAMGNRIANNGRDGVLVRDMASVSNSIVGNSIFGNTGLSINLQPPGELDSTPTPNDPCDFDLGPNQLQNFPIVTSVTKGVGGMTIKGTLNSMPTHKYWIDVYQSGALSPAGFGLAETYLGRTDAVRNPGFECDYTFALNVPTVYDSGWVTATATDQDTGDTSELSFAVPVPATIVIKPGNPTGPGGRGFNLSFNTVAGGIYRVERTTTLGDNASWVAVQGGEYLQGTGSSLSVTDPDAGTFSQAFYRVNQLQ